MKKTMAFFVVALLFFSCESDDMPNSKKLITESIDLNSDKKYDFKLNYSEFTTEDINHSAGEKFGEIIPIDENLILYDNMNGYLFLEKGDVIKKSNTKNQQWLPYGASVISKKRIYEVWDEIWTVKSYLTENYYLGIKLKNGSDEKLGWIKFEFNTSTGDVYILDSYMSSSNELVIEN
ncbi:MAG: hypothetical protein ACYCZ2_06185 [Lutibacter sp.]